MSDFLKADINDLMDGPKESGGNEYDRALEALKREDHEAIFGFKTKSHELAWPRPVRKRFLR